MKKTKKKVEMKIDKKINKKIIYLILTRVFNFLGKIPKSIQVLFHFCLPFLDFLGHVMHFCTFD
jgi:hypothetical protein